jgi:thymidylate kinase
MINDNIKLIFLRLNKAGIRYVVLRNYIPLDNLNYESDIDLLVDPKDKRRLIRVLKDEGFRSRFISNEDWNHSEVFKFDCTGNKIYIFDIQSSLFFSGGRFKLGSVNKILDNRELKKGIVFTPNEIHSFILLILHLAMDKKTVAKDRLQQAGYLYNQCARNKLFSEAVKKDFGKVISEYLFNKINEDAIDFSNHKFYKKFAEVIRNKFKIDKRSIFFSVHRKVRIIFNKIITFFRPIKLIVFVGVDGSGKTTLINELRKASPVFKTVLYLGLKDYFFKFMADLDSPATISNKKLRSIINKFKFFIYYFLLPFDFFLRYLRVKKGAKYGIVITDRFPLPKKHSAGGFLAAVQNMFRRFSLHLSYFFLPTPKLLFILTGEEKILWERKGDGSYEKFIKELDRCNKAKDTFNCKIKIIDTTKFNIEQTINKICCDICKYLQ